MKKIFLLAAIMFLGHEAFSQTAQSKKKATMKTNASAKQEKRIDEWEMKTYYLVFLKRGPNRSQDSVTAAKIQEGHLNHLDKLYKDGKMDLAGPLMEDGEIRGICVYNVPTLEEVKKLTEMDPAVQSGRLVVEIHPWYAAKGSVLR